MIECFFDGSTWPNPCGPASCGVYITEGADVLLKAGFYIGSGAAMSSNVAEYRAVIRCLEFLIFNGHKDKSIIVKGDSKLVIYQLSGRWKIKEGLYVESAYKAKALTKEFANISFEWIPREENEICDELAESALSDNGYRANVMEAIKDFHRSRKRKKRATA